MKIIQGDIVSFRVEHLINGVDVGRELAGRVMAAERFTVLVRVGPQRAAIVNPEGNRGRVVATLTNGRGQRGAVYVVPRSAITAKLDRNSATQKAA